MEKYEEIYKNSINDHKAKKRKLVIVDREQFQFARDITATILISLSIIVASVAYMIPNDEKIRIEMSYRDEVKKTGYNNYIDDTRYHLLDEMELFDLYLALPNHKFDEVLNYRGYQSLEEFFEKNNYENFDAWKNESIKTYKAEKKR